MSAQRAAGAAARTTLCYTVIYEPQLEGGYTASVPALPGCITEGDTLAEARSMAEDAIRCFCESLLADGQPLAPARPARGVPSSARR